MNAVDITCDMSFT